MQCVRLLAVVSVLTVAVSVVAHDARATTCGRYGDARVSPPPIDVRAPRNVKPRVTMHAAWRTQPFCSSWRDERVRCRSGDFVLGLRRAARREELPIDTRESTSGHLATVQLIPRALLAAGTRYEITRIDRTGHAPSEIVGTFMTSDAIDDVAPTWAGVRKADRVGLWPGEKPPPSTGNVITIDDFACGGPGVSFLGPSPAHDDATRDVDIAYAIWAAPGEEAIDYAAPPLTYARGAPSYAALALAIPFGTVIEPSDFSVSPAWSRARKVRFGLRAVDLAGNVSPESEIVVPVP